MKNQNGPDILKFNHFNTFFFHLSVILLFLYTTTLTAQENENCTLVGSWLEGVSFSVDIVDNLAYISNGSYFEVLDITDPFNPVETNSFLSRSFIGGMEVSNGYAYLANEKLGLQVLDISDPFNISEVSTMDFKSSNPIVQIDGTQAIYSSSDDLRFLDISDPSNPTASSVLEYDYWISKMATHNKLLFGATGWNGLRMIDYSDPSSPVEVDSFFRDGIYIYDLAIYGNYVITTGDDTLRIFDISDGLKLNQVFSGYLKSCNAIAVKDDNIYVTSEFHSKLNLYNLSDPESPELLQTYALDILPAIRTMKIAGNYLYAISQYGELLTMDISDPANITSSINRVASSYSYKLEMKDDFAIISQSRIGYALLDISVPENPIYLGNYLPGELGDQIALKDNYLYSMYGGLKIFDISDLQAPELISHLEFPGNHRDLLLKDNYAYIADYSNGLMIIDISDPFNPVELSRYVPEGEAVSVDVKGNLAFVTARFGGLRILDIGDPYNPIEIGYLDDLGNTGYVKIFDYLAFIGRYSGVSRIVDISDPYFPRVLDYNLGRGVEDVIISGEHAFVASGYLGFTVFDIFDPTHPEKIGFFQTQSYAKSVTQHEGKLYVVDNYSGLNIIEFDEGVNTFELDQASRIRIDARPNPFNSVLEVNIELPQKSEIKLTIKDLYGNTISTGNKEKHESENHSFTLKINPDLPPGLYFLLIDTQENSLVHKIVKSE